MDTKAFKRSLQHSENYHRKGFREAEVANLLQSEYQSNLVQQIRDNNYTLQRGDVTIRLAGVWFGGVERAVAMAYETPFPTERIWITNEIIHNPSVNQHLRNMQVEFIEVKEGQKDFSVVGGDVVILPAFGASVQEMQLLKDKGCTETPPALGVCRREAQKAITPRFTASTITKKQLLQVRLLLSIW